ncbi:hypothetical protein [Cupriavidus necator]
MLRLDDLIPKKVPVETKIGTLYVRHAKTSDWKFFDHDDAGELGKIVVQRLTNRIEDKRNEDRLSDEELTQLEDADFQALALAIAKMNNCGEMPPGAGQAEIGKAMKQVIADWVERNEKLYKSLRTNYGFLQDSSFQKLQEQMTSLADLRSSLAGTDWLNTASRNATEIRIETPRSFVLPRPEDSPLGRATLESAENSRLVAHKIDALVDVVAGLNQTMVQDVLPAWFKKLAEDQEEAKNAAKQAASGLFWTKWAVVLSVIVTALATWWQVWVARDIDRENSEQQRRAESILREQLATQRNSIDQQARDTAAMRDVVAALRSSTRAAVRKE